MKVVLSNNPSTPAARKRVLNVEFDFIVGVSNLHVLICTYSSLTQIIDKNFIKPAKAHLVNDNRLLQSATRSLFWRHQRALLMTTW